MQTQYSQCDQISNNIHKPGLFGTKALLGSVGGSTVREKPHFRDRGVPLSIPKEIAGSLFSQISWGKKIHLYPGLEPHEQSMLEIGSMSSKEYGWADRVPLVTSAGVLESTNYYHPLAVNEKQARGI